MDALDQQLISLLRSDARMSVAALAHRLKVSRGTVSNRIARLEADGVIVGYTVRLRPDAEPNEIHAWMCIAVEGNETRAVIASLLGEPGVASLHDTNGRWICSPDCAPPTSPNCPTCSNASASSAASAARKPASIWRRIGFEAGKKFGVNMKEIYWTMGQYDMVVIAEAPDDASLSAFTLAVGSAGNIRGQTLRAHAKDEMNALLSKLA
jgi:DNA-binding Lrp family transcriptional regulator